LLLAPAFRLALLGAAMFLASDVILSVQIFRLAPGTPAHRNAGRAVWPLYWGGQALIAYGVIGGLAI
ncbi:MAG: lysoplasmalogenase family protein, partial [Alterinioella nitratireducens]|uniref:lysoplasmalogenase family protein n=1 Tax=Alterinioella nitratireducens TaxID=2735915 RepID=UPI004059089E